jgi:hypothetical protein
LSETPVSPRKEESISTFQHLDLANDRTTVHAVVPSNKLSDDGQKYVRVVILYPKLLHALERHAHRCKSEYKDEILP